MSASSPPPRRDARIDWAQGRVVGFSVPGSSTEAFELVQLHVDGRCVASDVACRSVFDLATELAGLELPAREHSAFELRIPARVLPHDLHRDALVRLEVCTAQGVPIFDADLCGLRDLLRLSDQPPADLLYAVRLRGVVGGALRGTVVDRHRTGLLPRLYVVLNGRPPEPLPLFDASADGTVHHFSVPLRPDHLDEGANLLRIAAADGQPLAAYPIRLGAQGEAELERRLAVCEAELAFLKRVALIPHTEALPERLALLKGEILGLCSELMALQRVQLEREPPRP